MATHQIKITSPYREVTEEDKHLVQVRIDPEEIMSFLPTNFMFGESRITLPIRYFRLVHINGQPKFVKHDEDSWRDIVGYASLVADRLLQEQSQQPTSNP